MVLNKCCAVTAIAFLPVNASCPLIVLFCQGSTTPILDILIFVTPYDVLLITVSAELVILSFLFLSPPRLSANVMTAGGLSGISITTYITIIIG